MNRKPVLSHRVDMWEGRRRVSEWRLRDMGKETEITHTSSYAMNRSATAKTLLLICTTLLDDYLKWECQALIELVVNDIADSEWAESQRDADDLPF